MSKNRQWSTATSRPNGEADDRAEALAELDPLDLTPEIARVRAILDLALQDLSEARRIAADARDNVSADPLARATPSDFTEQTKTILKALEVAGKLQRAYSQNRAQDAIPRASVVEAFTRIRALIAQFVPEQERQRALLAAIGRISFAD